MKHVSVFAVGLLCMVAGCVQYKGHLTQPTPAGYDHEKIVNEISAQTTWFTEQITGFIAKDKFAQYLNIN